MLSGKLWLREIRKLSENGRQVSILSTNYKADYTVLAVSMLARWQPLIHTLDAHHSPSVAGQLHVIVQQRDPAVILWSPGECARKVCTPGSSPFAPHPHFPNHFPFNHLQWISPPCSLPFWSPR